VNTDAAARLVLEWAPGQGACVYCNGCRMQRRRRCQRQKMTSVSRVPMQCDCTFQSLDFVAGVDLLQRRVAAVLQVTALVSSLRLQHLRIATGFENSASF
jgi:hypothetical protein